MFLLMGKWGGNIDVLFIYLLYHFPGFCQIAYFCIDVALCLCVTQCIDSLYSLLTAQNLTFENCYCFKYSRVESKEAYKQYRTAWFHYCLLMNLCVKHISISKGNNGTMRFCYHCRTSFTGVRKMVCCMTK